MRVPHRKKYKMIDMTSSISNFQNLRKTDLASICQIILGKFRKNLTIRLGFRDDTQRQTHRQTQRHTHRQTHSTDEPTGFARD